MSTKSFSYLVVTLLLVIVKSEPITKNVQISPESVIIYDGRRILTSKHCEKNPSTEDFDYPGFKYPQLDELSPTAIHKCTSLTVLNLPSHRITTFDSEFFINSESLTYLSLACNHITSLHQDLLKPLKNLETLILNGNPIQTIQPILQSRLIKLNDLEIENCELLEEDIDVDMINQKLTSLARIRYHHNLISCRAYTKLDGRFEMRGLQFSSEQKQSVLGTCERTGSKLCLDNDEELMFQQLRLITKHINGSERIKVK